ncbi:isoprenoid synthase domain-containing protein [Gorgonomyces haynaldii]|nr:isoprenoid synthase domain-containing protein [Gorgonomyces haynaldii]
MSAQRYCLDLVRKFDYDAYCVSLFSPARDALLVSRAFNIEIASIQDIVTKPEIGRMRIQWWRDTIEKTFQGNAPVHPVPLAIARILQHTDWNIQQFHRMLDAREQLLTTPQFESLSQMEIYSEQTQGSLLQLHLQALGIEDETSKQMAGHLGVSWGLTLLLKSTPFLLQKNQFLLASELMAQHQLSTEQVLRGKADISPVIYDIAVRANDHLLTIDTLDLPKEATKPRLHQIPVQDYLNRLQQKDFDVFNPELRRKTLAMLFKLWRGL